MKNVVIMNRVIQGGGRRGSTSSIGSTTSNKSREASSDFKDTKSSAHQEEKEAVSKDNVPIAAIQPGSSLFSPLRGGTNLLCLVCVIALTQKIENRSRKCYSSFLGF